MTNDEAYKLIRERAKALADNLGRQKYFPEIDLNVESVKIVMADNIRRAAKAIAGGSEN